MSSYNRVQGKEELPQIKPGLSQMKNKSGSVQKSNKHEFKIPSVAPRRCGKLSAVLYCAVLCYAALYYAVLYSAVLYCTAL